MFHNQDAGKSIYMLATFIYSVVIQLFDCV